MRVSKQDSKDSQKNGLEHKTEKDKSKVQELEGIKEDLTKREMEVVTTVFRNFETGLRRASILPKDLHDAMKMLGLNPMEQEIIDLTNNIVKDGFIYFPEFCKVIHKKFREDDEELFRQNMFKILCGTEPFPEKFKAKKYKLHDHFITKKSFFQMMTNLPEKVDEEDIEEMFSYADKDKDGKISYLEFQAMINPPKPPTEPTTSLTPTPVKRVTIKTTEKDEDLVDIIDTDLLADVQDKIMTPETTK